MLNVIATTIGHTVVAMIAGVAGFVVTACVMHFGFGFTPSDQTPFLNFIPMVIAGIWSGEYVGCVIWKKD